MKSVFSTGPKLITGLLMLLVSGSLLAQTAGPASYVKPGIDLSVYNKVLVKPNIAEVFKPFELTLGFLINA